MKNLFDYATKELSQDAFLRWLFESWEDPEADILVRRLLKKFCDLDEKVKSIKTTAQEKNIDIKVRITTESGKDVFLFIEDKTFSNEHSQLSEYDKYIDGNFENVCKVFYKTNKISDDDRRGIEKANRLNGSSKWTIADIDDIVESFESCSPYNNLILQNYFDYVKRIKSNIETFEKPQTNDGNVDLLKWEAYFKNSIIPKLKKDGYKAFARKAGQYPYVCLVIKKDGFTENAPYLEIRSRDCVDDGFTSRILCYGIPNEILASRQEKLIDNVRQSGFRCDGLRTKRKGNRIFPKQVGYTDKTIAKTTEDFLRLTEIYAKEFLAVMKDWS